MLLANRMAADCAEDLDCLLARLDRLSEKLRLQGYQLECDEVAETHEKLQAIYNALPPIFTDHLQPRSEQVYDIPLQA